MGGYPSPLWMIGYLRYQVAQKAGNYFISAGGSNIDARSSAASCLFPDSQLVSEQRRRQNRFRVGCVVRMYEIFSVRTQMQHAKSITPFPFSFSFPSPFFSLLAARKPYHVDQPGQASENVMPTQHNACRRL